jgi:hypothetical protein
MDGWTLPFVLSSPSCPPRRYYHFFVPYNGAQLSVGPRIRQIPDAPRQNLSPRQFAWQNRHLELQLCTQEGRHGEGESLEQAVTFRRALPWPTNGRRQCGFRRLSKLESHDGVRHEVSLLTPVTLPVATSVRRINRNRSFVMRILFGPLGLI